MVITRSKLMLILGISLMACALGSAWALLSSAEGRAGVGIYSLNVRENQDGETWIKAVSEYDIDRDTPVQYNRFLYRESTVWGNDDLGRWSSWPW